ncbi:hypothetical protein, partial [Vibrio splendidus]|uniref:hypothetical protein n=1 Tax=Vibrio splendidus TaxID=29497 RepID=UPI0018E45021
MNHSGGCGSEAGKNSGGGGGGGGSSRVICTHFYRKGMLDAEVWRADLQYTQNHLSETTVRGYHYWAIPYVELMRKSPLAEKIRLFSALLSHNAILMTSTILTNNPFLVSMDESYFYPVTFSA